MELEKELIIQDRFFFYYQEGEDALWQCQKEKLESGMKMTMLVDILQRMDILSYVRNMG